MRQESAHALAELVVDSPALKLLELALERVGANHDRRALGLGLQLHHLLLHFVERRKAAARVDVADQLLDLRGWEGWQVDEF